MAGFSSVGSGNTAVTTLVADNVNFSGSNDGPTISSNGQLLIGSAASPNIQVGALQSPLGSLIFGYNSPNITCDISTSSAISGTIGSLQYFSNANGDSYISPYWLKCDGSTYSQATYPTLFNRLGLLNPPGSVWTQRTSQTGGNINALTYGTVFVYAGTNNGVNAVLGTSTDGITWTGRNPGTIALQLQCLTFGNALYVYGGVTGALGTSTDAITWVARTSGTSTQINALTYGTVYVYAGAGGVISSSTDAITWTARPSGTLNTLNALSYGNSVYIASGVGSTVCTSTDGTTWSTTHPTIGTAGVNGIFLAFGNSTFIGCAASGTLSSSTDGITWTGRVTGTTSALTAVTYGTAYITGGTGGLIESSTDAITWTARTSGTSSNILALTYGTVHVYAGGGGTLATSTDGTTWTSRTSGTASIINALVYGTVYVYGGAGGVVASSTDAITWTVRTSQTTTQINALTYGNGLYVYGTNAGGIGTSTDGTTWVARTSNTTTNILALAYGAGVYVYGGVVNALASSTDAITWTPRFNSIESLSSLPISGAQTPITGIVFANSKFYASTTLGYVMTSTDGITWVTNSNGADVNNTPYGALTYGTNFVMGGGNGLLYTSTNGASWTARTSNTTATIVSLTYGAGLYVYGTGSGSNVIGTSTDSITWNTTAGTITNSSSLGALTNNGSIFVSGMGNVPFQTNIQTSATTYSYNTATQFQVPTNAAVNGDLTTEFTSNFKRSLYIKAL